MDKQTYPAIYIADYVISQCELNKIGLNNLKLQKILFYLKARFLVEDNYNLFNDSIQKWKFGPVVPEVYHEYKNCGAEPITKQNISSIVRYPKDGEKPNLLGIFVKEEFDENKICESVREKIYDTVKKLGKYSGFDLVEKTHDQEIWKDYEKEILSGRKGIGYTDDEIKTYFEKNVNDQIWL
ncbi:Panacea domain-containing protein [Enterococcus innesii]|nr:type II toxin-antitoxin system antitoxin SocA domain-containing protein [Enterococcus innesii]